MINFSRSKINLGLYVTGKRQDGYHNLESIFLPIEFTDAIELIPAQKNKLFLYGKQIPGSANNNSTLLTLQLMQKEFSVQPYHIHLLKNIPTGAGLGGGSANSAAVINIVNQLDQLNLSIAQRQQLALQIGSDNAFFVDQNPAYVSGRGDEIQSCKLKLSGYPVVIIIPPVHQSTAAAYKQVEITETPSHLKTITVKQLVSGDVLPTNAFQQPFLNQFPSSTSILIELNKAGAFYSSLSGSGSAFYGLFEKNKEIPNSLQLFALENGYSYIETQIL